jgi:transposase, IS30 family
MQIFNHLRLEQRYQIEALLETGITQTQIAVIIGVHKSTVSRELRRNKAAKGPYSKTYASHIAQRRYSDRQLAKRKNTRFTSQMKQEARHWLQEDRLSPELISASWKRNGQPAVSHERLYQWIWSAKKSKHRDLIEDSELYKCLRHGKRRQKRGNQKHTRGIIKHRTPIDQRPELIERRERIGDIEVDLMMGKEHKSALLVMTDRATLITTMDFLAGKDSKAVKEKIEDRINWIGSSWIKTMTFDNDMAFALHHEIQEKYSIKTYFTRPYTSQDKGTVENRIGLITAFLHRKTDLNLISDQEIASIEDKINNRPIRKFGYLTPREKLLSYKRVAIVA